MLLNAAMIEWKTCQVAKWLQIYNFGVLAFGTNVRSSIFIIRHFDCQYKMIYHKIWCVSCVKRPGDQACCIFVCIGSRSYNYWVYFTSTLWLVSSSWFNRKFTNEAVIELERFYSQKVSDFRSILINFVQLQMHINKKVIIVTYFVTTK
jgi:hypothetical protein